MLTKKQQNDLKSFAAAIAVPLSNTDADKWPIRAGRIGKLCLGELCNEFFADIEALRQQGWSLKKIAKLFYNPTHLWPISHHLINGLRKNNIPLEIQQKYIFEHIEMIRALKYGDPFCKNGKNIIWSPQEVTKKTTKLSNTVDMTTSRLIHALSGILWSYAEAPYFVANDLALEIHGPYTLKNGKKLLVRDIFNMHPNDLWPSIKSFLPYNNIQIMTVYNTFDAWLDVYNNLYLNQGMVLTKELSGWKVLVNGKSVDESRLQTLIAEASTTIKDISELVDSWSLKEIARQYINVFWYRKKVLRDALHKDWRPPKEILDRVETHEIPDPASSNPSYEELKKTYTLF